MFGDVSVGFDRVDCVDVEPGCASTTFVVTAQQVGSDSHIELQTRNHLEPFGPEMFSWVRALSSTSVGCAPPRNSFVYFRASSPS